MGEGWGSVREGRSHVSPAPEAEFLETLFGGWKAEGRSLLSPCFVCLVSSASPARDGGGILCSLAPGPALHPVPQALPFSTCQSLAVWLRRASGASPCRAGMQTRRV